ncbi:hypothetical protein [Rheinheimera hassiensis]|uniref:hypothetical protein n=1 Tax=Rheinheimera hassiensis TaxID=1193627 RepID=UPI001F066151|nr:hypothetical protein [Rheinheimera hassiensis]
MAWTSTAARVSACAASVSWPSYPLTVNQEKMFLIKKNEVTFMLWWKFIGAIVMSVFMVFAIREGSFFVSVRGEVITIENRPIMFPILIVSFVLMTMLSYWQGGYGLYQKYFVNQKQ